MKVMKIVTANSLFCAIGYFFGPFILSLPEAPSPHAIFLFLTGTLVLALEYWWSGFKAFSRALPPVVRLFIGGLLALMVFKEIGPSGFFSLSSLTAMTGASMFVGLIFRR